MNRFRQELLNSLNSSFSYPNCIQRLIDNGIVQDCVMVNGTYYLLFSFYLENQEFYNYKSRAYIDFVFAERVDVIYVGGLSVDENGKILKGIINPFYLKMRSADMDNIFDESFNETTPYIVGTPQVFNKNDRLNLRDVFPSNYFRVFNLATNKSTTWTSFLLGKESYEHTSYGMTYGYSSCFGELYDEHFKCIEKRKYHGYFARNDEAVTIQFVEDKLKNKKLLSSITNMLICNPNNGLSKIAKAYKDGMKEISNSINKAGRNIRTGTSNIANSLNKYPDVVGYN